uniref:Uncharacterized protein n=1 Tax=Setaria viridis TaxID=4556 RepID=A0A4U6TDF4_SETVI|nr:hypothetical protein SEVIR_9G571450v2 [Setaria viridis]
MEYLACASSYADSLERDHSVADLRWALSAVTPSAAPSAATPDYLTHAALTSCYACVSPTQPLNAFVLVMGL